MNEPIRQRNDCPALKVFIKTLGIIDSTICVRLHQKMMTQRSERRRVDGVKRKPQKTYRKSFQSTIKNEYYLGVTV